MRKLLRWTGLLCLTLLISVCVARLYGHTQKTMLNAFGLGLCQDRPCFSGIIPGETAWDEVYSHIDLAEIEYEQVAGVQVNRVAFNANAKIFKSSVDETRVSDVFISSYAARYWNKKDFLLIGDFIATYGVPCKVVIDVGSYDYYFSVQEMIYPNMSVSMNIKREESFDPSTPISIINIRQPQIRGEESNLCMTYEYMNSGITWNGFAARWHYKAVWEEKKRR